PLECEAGRGEYLGIVGLRVDRDPDDHRGPPLARPRDPFEDRLAVVERLLARAGVDAGDDVRADYVLADRRGGDRSPELAGRMIVGFRSVAAAAARGLSWRLPLHRFVSPGSDDGIIEVMEPARRRACTGWLRRSAGPGSLLRGCVRADRGRPDEAA